MIGEGLMCEWFKGYGIEFGLFLEVLWNFEKFLVSCDGQVVVCFVLDVVVDDLCLLQVIEIELNKFWF